MPLEFDEQTHAYTLDGAVVPSVTEVLDDVGIIDYSRIPEGTRMMALERGRHVHQICQFHDEGDLGTFGPALAGYLGGWQRFRTEFGFKPELIEHRGFSQKFRYAGTLDRRSGDVLLDIKTGVAPAWTQFQTAAYAHFFESAARYRRMAVELHADGTYKIHEYRCKDFSRDLGVFLAALTVFNAKRTNQ